ncbi:ribosome maturation factor RimM [Synergistales bacterium]|nr:ribosome maturation factor RimM [Synergistales bacterium]
MSISSKNNERILIGRVSSAHGIRGEIRVTPLTDFPERFQDMKTIDLYAEEHALSPLHVLHVSRMRFDGKGDIILESDIKDRTSAEKLSGFLIFVDKEERVSLPDGHFWVDDLLGLTVVAKSGEKLGVVDDYLSSGGNELYVVKDNAGKFHYIPAVGEFIKNIDIASSTITVSLIDGLW